MIPVKRPPHAPDGFDENVRNPGLAWLERTRERGHRGKPPSYWTWCEPHLCETFQRRCGWSAIFVTSGQVEHFVSQSCCLEDGGDPALIYDWDNYRYIMPELNSSKKRVDGLLDPYEVGAGWFRLILPSLRVELTNEVPPAVRDRARDTLRRLKLAEHAKIRRVRETWLDVYQRGEVSSSALHRFDPMLAEAILRLFEADPGRLTEAELGLREKLRKSRERAGAATP